MPNNHLTFLKELFQAETRYQRQVVTETLSLIVHALVGATGKIAPIELVLLQQELGGMDKDILHLIIYIRRHQDMVEAVPLALIAIGPSTP